jgi:hypothetical protein
MTSLNLGLTKEYTDLMAKQGQNQETRDPNDSYSNFRKESSPQEEESSTDTTHNRKKESSEQSAAVKRYSIIRRFYSTELNSEIHDFTYNKTLE